MIQFHAMIYERPYTGSRFIGRFPIYNYRHKITAFGNFDTASGNLGISRDRINELFERFVGADVSIVANNPFEPCWEGYIDRITVNMGAQSFTMGLDEMLNRISITYKAPDVSTTNPQNPTGVTANNAGSQDLYGVKEGNYDGQVIEGTTVSKFTNLLKIKLALLGYPQKTTVINSSGGDFSVSMEMKGWYHVLDWQKYLDTASASAITPTAALTSILAGYTNTRFIDVADTSEIQPNSAWSQNPKNQAGGTVLQFVQSLVEPGDGNTQWVFGVNARSNSTGKRNFYYRAMTAQVNYTMRYADGRLRNRKGLLVDPWKVSPDCGIKLFDNPIPTVAGLDDPDSFWLETVEFDSNSMSVSLSGADDITPEGVFELRHFYKRTGKRFGAPVRTVY